MHEELGHWVAVEHDCEDALHGIDLALVGPLLELRAQLGHGGHIGEVVLVHQAVGALEEGGHCGWFAPRIGRTFVWLLLVGQGLVCFPSFSDGRGQRPSIRGELSTEGSASTGVSAVKARSVVEL